MLSMKKNALILGSLLLAVACTSRTVDSKEDSKVVERKNVATIHYQRQQGDYENQTVWAWEDAVSMKFWPEGYKKTGTSDFGAYYEIPLEKDAEKVGFLFVNSATEQKDGDDRFFNLNETDSVWVFEGQNMEYYNEPVALADNQVRVHYQRQDGIYDPWTLWVWNDVNFNDSKGWPHGLEPQGRTSYGVYFDVEVTGTNIGMKPANTADGGGDGGDRNFNKLNDYRELFISDRNDNIYVGPNMELPDGIERAEILTSNSIILTFSNADEVDINKDVVIKDNTGRTIEKLAVTRDGHQFTVEVSDIDEALLPYTITYEDYTINARRGWVYIDAMYAYDGELGVFLNEDGTAKLKMWSPMVHDVKVILYDKDNHDKVVKDNIQMTKNDNGVWSVVLNERNTGIADLTGYYYNYKVDAKGDGDVKVALDPYAPSMAPFDNKKYHIGRGAILNPRTIGPELDYAVIPGFEKREDAIIWEAHVRDFTVDPSIEGDLNARFGTFRAFIDKLDYISDLGVTHVQLLPIMSYMWGSDMKAFEREMHWSSLSSNYNWGYDPHSYFSVSGMYSEDPRDPALRIAELKELIAAIHDRGMGVILDVVYNHTASVHIFEDLMPNYYHFMDADGTSRTSFGGGRLGTTHEMARRILVDSILYWTDVFKVDGFRFDMMGDHDAESIQIAFDRAKELNPNIIMIGEGWRTFYGDEGDPRQPADQDWMQYTEAVGVFSDEFRNELKSGFGSEGQPRFITGGKRNIGVIFDNVKAQPHNFVADQPGDVVPYIAAHDNLTLHDVIAQSTKKDPDFHQDEIHRRIRIGNAMVLTSQGTAFIHAGQEYGRTKQWRDPNRDNIPTWKETYRDGDGNKLDFKFPYFIHDSYDSTDIINMFDWTKATNAELYPINNKTREYTTGLIHLRRSTDAFRLGSKELVDRNVQLLYPTRGQQDLIIAYSAKSTDGEEYLIFINADEKTREFSIGTDLRNVEIIVDENQAGTTPISNPSGVKVEANKVTLDPLTVVIFRR